MSTQLLLLDRVEFLTIKVSANLGEFKANPGFPQLAIDFEKIEFLARSDLVFSPDEIDDPRHFIMTYGIMISSEQEANKNFPYEIEVEVAGYFRYVGGDEFKEERRFRAVRFSGYQILYGSIREMVCNLTARGRHGLLNLPARNFGSIAEAQAQEDEVRRKNALLGVTIEKKKTKSKIKPKSQKEILTKDEKDSNS